jgi:pimeloyl-ACP methyl ester carboxylesterase
MHTTSDPSQEPVRRLLHGDGVELSCLDFGGAGPPVLLLHGLAGHAGEWREMASWLTRGHRVFALDERGHGHSTRAPGDVSPEARVADVALVVEELAGEATALVGQSLGANLAFLTAARHPALVRALVVAEGYAGADPEGEGAAAIDRWLASWPMPFAVREDAVAFFGGSLRGEAWADGLEQREDGLWPRFDRDVIVRMLREGTARERWSEWEQIDCPTLVLRAGAGYFAAADLEAMAALISRGRYGEIDGAGHDLHLERPEAWRRVLEDFLTRS